MLVVKFLLFIGSDVEVGADLFANHLLRNNLITHVLFEILVGNSLRGSRLFQLLHGLQLHVLAHLIKPLDQVGVTRNSKVFAFFKQELLVDEIAQDVLFTLAKQLVGVGRILLFNVVLQLVLAAEELRPGDD